MTTSVSRSSSAFTRSRGDSGASPPWTTWPRLQAGPCLEHRSKVLTRPTGGFNGEAKPKIFQDAEKANSTEHNSQGLKGQFYHCLSLFLSYFLFLFFFSQHRGQRTALLLFHQFYLVFLKVWLHLHHICSLLKF